MDAQEFSKQVQRIARILALHSSEDSISTEAMDAASKALQETEGLTNEDRFLIVEAAKFMLDHKPIDMEHTKKYRGHVDLSGTGRMYVEVGTKGVIYV